MCRLAESRGLLAAGSLLLAAAAAWAGPPLRLERTTPVQLQSSGALGNAAPVLLDMLARYLRASLQRDSLDGQGPPIVIEVSAEAETWSKLPALPATALTEMDRFSITVDAGARTVRIHGRTAVAAGFGVSQFIEQSLGVRWLFPGELGTAYVGAPPFDLPDGSQTREPAFFSRIYTGMTFLEPGSHRWGYDGIVHQQRAFFRGWDYFKSLKLRHFSYASHNLINIFPVTRYGQSAPDIYPLVDGQRFIPPADPKARLYEAWHVCYTNPKTVDIAVAAAEDYFAGSDGGTFSLGINDGTPYECQCPACRAAGGVPLTYLNWVNAVADRVRRRYPPPHTLGVLAYQSTSFPPGFDANGPVPGAPPFKLADNVIVLTSAGDDGQAIERWSAAASHLAVYEYLYGWGYWWPNFPLRGMQRNARYYRDHGVQAMHAEVHPLWAFDGPKVYIRSRLLWDPDLDVDSALDDYCAAAFGPGGTAMSQLYRHWAGRRDDDVGAEGVSPMCDFALFRHSETQFAAVDAADYNLTAELLVKAAASGGSDAERARLAMVRAFFDLSRTLFEMWRNKNDIFAAEDAALPALLERGRALATRHAELRLELRAHPEWFAGSVQDLDRIEGRQWEGRWEWYLDYEHPNAVRTAELRLGLGNWPAAARRLVTLGDLALYRRQYAADKWSPMALEMAGDRHRFAASDDGGHSYLRGATPLRQDRLYLADVVATLAHGELQLRLHNMNVCGKTIGTGCRAEASRTVHFQVLLKPVPTWGDDREVADLDVEMLWYPAAAGRLTGTMRLFEVTPAAAGTGADEETVTP